MATGRGAPPESAEQSNVSYQLQGCFLRRKLASEIREIKKAALDGTLEAADPLSLEFWRASAMGDAETTISLMKQVREKYGNEGLCRLLNREPLTPAEKAP